MLTPGSTKYNPKSEYFLPRTPVVLDWNKSIKANFSRVQKDDVQPQYYISHQPVHIEGKNFVDLARTSRRDNSILNTNGDVRIRRVQTGVRRPKSAQKCRVEEEEERMNKSHEEILLKHHKFDSIAEKKIHRKTCTTDFKKNLTREYQNNLFSKNIPILSYSRPNVKYTKPSIL